MKVVFSCLLFNSIGLSANTKAILLVRPERFELPTNGLGNRCSIHLRYGRMVKKRYGKMDFGYCSNVLHFTMPGSAGQ